MDIWVKIHAILWIDKVSLSCIYPLSFGFYLYHVIILQLFNPIFNKVKESQGIFLLYWILFVSIMVFIGYIHILTVDMISIGIGKQTVAMLDGTYSSSGWFQNNCRNIRSYWRTQETQNDNDDIDGAVGGDEVYQSVPVDDEEIDAGLVGDKEEYQMSS
jgi:hypothetical protein